MKRHIALTAVVALLASSTALYAAYGDVARFKRECFASGGERVGWRDGSLICVGGKMSPMRVEKKTSHKRLKKKHKVPKQIKTHQKGKS